MPSLMFSPTTDITPTVMGLAVGMSVATNSIPASRSDISKVVNHDRADQVREQQVMKTAAYPMLSPGVV
jgi:hypothetical protein